MKTLNIEGGLGGSRILAGGKLAQLGDLLQGLRPVIVTDENVHQAHGKMFPHSEMIVLEPGEGSKTLTTAEAAYRRLMDLDVDRSGFLLGIGGGVVSDITGFVASTYMRGISFGLVPTTLLAQVDAAIGGKNGVNLDGYKNMVGTFAQPHFVLCDVSFLRTLPEAELRNGLAEAVKSGAIGDPALFELIYDNAAALLANDAVLMEQVVERAASVKALVVNEDERESGRRRILNFGHTLGHAIELEGGTAHGEAISIGMVMAAKLSAKRGLIDADEAARLGGCLASLGLPTGTGKDAKAISSAIRKDKKRYGDSIKFVLLEEIGRARVEDVGLAEIQEAIDDMR